MGALQFKLAVYGRGGNVHATLSCVERVSQPLVDTINAQLRPMAPFKSIAEARVSALAVMKRHGFGDPDPRGWFEAPSPSRQ
jgi:hypothetical protein